MNKKTDLQIMRNLADYIITLGGFKHDEFKGAKRLELLHEEKDYISLYTDGIR